MSAVFDPTISSKESMATVQRLLDENSALIQTINQQQKLGRLDDVVKYQQLLHRNLVYLARVAEDSALLRELQGDEQQAAIPSSSTNGDQTMHTEHELKPTMMSTQQPAHHLHQQEQRGAPSITTQLPQGPSSQPHTPLQQHLQQASTPQPMPRGSPSGAPMTSPGQQMMGQQQPPQQPQQQYYPGGGQPSPGQRYPPQGQQIPPHPYNMSQQMMGQGHPMQQHPGQPSLAHQMGHQSLQVPHGHQMQGQPSPSQQGQMPSHYYNQAPQQGYPGMGPPPQHMMHPQHPQMSQQGPPPGYSAQMYGGYGQQHQPPPNQQQQPSAQQQQQFMR
ncbi:unnamed protein product, partial [Mesorhabditis belari]|uniref:SS18 N-terminal domain-containing protein n=1 Tax=Mesorhabditis belari TaxID=2138241 RepID=A0AAF3ESV0_9BILA